MKPLHASEETLLEIEKGKMKKTHFLCTADDISADGICKNLKKFDLTLSDIHSLLLGLLSISQMSDEGMAIYRRLEGFFLRGEDETIDK